MLKVTALAFVCTLILKTTLLVLATLFLFSLILIEMLLNLRISKAAIALPLLIEQRLRHRNFHL